MKKFFLTMAMMGCLCLVQAQIEREREEESEQKEKVLEQDQPDEKIKISAEELPDAIKTALDNDSYKGWSIEEAKYNKTKDIYEVEVRKGTESKVVKFTKDGNIIE